MFLASTPDDCSLESGELSGGKKGGVLIENMQKMLTMLS
jgi:hypothetical protein